LLRVRFPSPTPMFQFLTRLLKTHECQRCRGRAGPSGPRAPFRIGWALAPVVVFSPKERVFQQPVRPYSMPFPCRSMGNGPCRNRRRGLPQCVTNRVPQFIVTRISPCRMARCCTVMERPRWQRASSNWRSSGGPLLFSRYTSLRARYSNKLVRLP
jgi:hypothetical protein